MMFDRNPPSLKGRKRRCRPRRNLVTRLLNLALSVSMPCAAANAEVPPSCYGAGNYATQSALVALVNSGRVADAESIYRDDKTPYGLTTALLDAEPVGRFSGPGLPESTVVRQIQKIDVKTRGGDAFVLLTISEVSAAECSLAAPTVILMHPDYAVLRVGASVVAGPGDR